MFVPRYPIFHNPFFEKITFRLPYAVHYPKSIISFFITPITFPGTGRLVIPRP